MTTSEFKTLLRLFVSRENISRGESAELSEGQHHYLRNVMRVKPGDRLRSFNGRNGEWLAEVTELSKKKAVISFLEKIREQSASSDVRILASPVKKEAFDIMVEKSAELGAANFQPVACERTVVHRANEDRLNAIAIEAAEQCERLDIMTVEPLADLKNVLATWPSSRKLIFCLERAEVPPIAGAVRSLGAASPGLLIGPEGGFSDGEIAFITKLPFVVPVSLGRRILKAETALIAALACIQLA